MNKIRKLLNIFSPGFILVIVLLACSSNTTTSVSPTSTTTSATPGIDGSATLQSIDAFPMSVEIRTKGGTRQLGVTAIYANGTRQDITAKCAFKSSDEKVATVSAAGIITAIADGTCQITVSYSEKGAIQTDSVSVNVWSGFITPVHPTKTS